MEQKPETMSCIGCDASHCVHHVEGDLCNAGFIKVGTPLACSSNETCCDTFKAKSE